MMLLASFFLLSSCCSVAAFHIHPQQSSLSRIGAKTVVRCQFSNPQQRRLDITSTTTTTLRVETTSSSSDAVGVAEPPPSILKKVITPGSGPTLQRGDVATVSYSLYIPEDGTIISRGQQQKVNLGDGTMIAGWDMALSGMTVGERAIVRIPSALAYGPKGVPPLIPPGATLELDITVLSSAAPTGILGLDFDGLAYADNTPRTADQIAAAYEKRQAKAALIPKKEGLEGWIETARSYYFFGFFEGETGQQAPWLLRPSITFPIIFAIVGFAFYVSYSTGAISERGIPATDELDEIVLTTTTLMMKQLVL